MAEVMEGTIVRLLGEKGFGFIKGPDNQEYFFHREQFGGFFEDLITDVNAGRKIKVTFSPVQSSRGPRAGNVNRVDNGV